MNITLDVAQTIAALGTLLTAVGTLATVLIGLHNSKLSRKNESSIAETAAKVDRVHDAVSNQKDST